MMPFRIERVAAVPTSGRNGAPKNTKEASSSVTGSTLIEA